MMNSQEQDLEVKKIKVQKLTKKAFEPFGEVITIEGNDRLPIDLYDEIDVYRGSVFESDQPVEFLINRMRLREFRLIYLERHMELTQTFIPLAGQPFILVVAKPDARMKDDVPYLEEIKAFFVSADQALNIHRGTWHEPPFPLVENSINMTTSHRSLTSGLETPLNERSEISNLDVEKRNVTERTGFIIRLELP